MQGWEERDKETQYSRRKPCRWVELFGSTLRAMGVPVEHTRLPGHRGSRGRSTGRQAEAALTFAAVCDQQHFSVLAPSDLLDDVEALLDLQLSQALRCDLHQLLNEAAVSQSRRGHLGEHEASVQPLARSRAHAHTHTHTHTHWETVGL